MNQSGCVWQATKCDDCGDGGEGSGVAAVRAKIYGTRFRAIGMEHIAALLSLSWHAGPMSVGGINYL